MLKFIISNLDVCQALCPNLNRRFFMKYMHAIGQYEQLSFANDLLLVQIFSQADKLRTVSQRMPGV